MVLCLCVRWGVGKAPKPPHTLLPSLRPTHLFGSRLRCTGTPHSTRIPHTHTHTQLYKQQKATKAAGEATEAPKAALKAAQEAADDATATRDKAKVALDEAAAALNAAPEVGVLVFVVFCFVFGFYFLFPLSSGV